MNKRSISDLSRALYTLNSGMTAQNKRMMVISQNLASAGVRASAPDKMPYLRKVVSFSNVYDPKLQTEVIKVKEIIPKNSEPERVYDPSDPAAGKNGFVMVSNVKPMVEMIDLQETAHSHTANLRAFERVLSMVKGTIGLMK